MISAFLLASSAAIATSESNPIERAVAAKEREFYSELCLIPPDTGFTAAPDDLDLQPPDLATQERQDQRRAIGSTLASTPEFGAFGPRSFSYLEGEDGKGNKLAGRLQLETSSDDGRATIGFDYTEPTNAGGFNTYSASMSTPVNKGGDTNFGGVGDFASDIRFSFSFSRTTRAEDNELKSNRTRPSDLRRQLYSKIMENLRKACPAIGDTEIAATPITFSSIACQERYAFIEGVKAKMAARGLEADLSDQIELSSRCIELFLGKSRRDKYVDEVFTPRPFLLYGLKGDIGHRQFDVATPFEMDNAEENRTPWSVSASLAAVTKDRKQLVRVGYSYAKRYKAAKSSIVCRNIDDIDCVEGVFAEPNENTDHAIFTEYRRSLDKSNYIRGLSMKFSYDLEDSEPQVEIPLYFLTDTNNKFDGGVKFQWNEEDNFVAGVFVGADFSVLN